MAKKKPKIKKGKQRVYTLNDPPKGKLRTNRRPFEDVVHDLRFAVATLARVRRTSDDPENDTPFTIIALGSGFFVAPQIFMTCGHCLNAIDGDEPLASHREGDSYWLISKVSQVSGFAIMVEEPRIGESLFIYPDSDLAILYVPDREQDAPYVSLDFTESKVGQEIGVAGFPLAEITPDKDGQAVLTNVRYRVAKGVVTCRYRETFNDMADVPLIEVNFLFVPGNSGGPVFDPGTGRVRGYVHGYTSQVVNQELSVSAVYSMAIEMAKAREHLEEHGVSL